jgi:dipeptidyl aminopeptidase/acylaminoacyl peptidase
LADAGILYLGLIWSAATSDQREEDYYPKGYPGYKGQGGIAEAAFNMDLWDSAVDALAKQGMVDPSRVGIIGFSRTGWYTEFILTHAKTKYRAATLSDNVHYSLGEYWLRHDDPTMRAWDHLYDGPPYGASLRNWMQYSISFTIDKIRAPILMEEMQDNQPTFDDPLAPPRLLAEQYEIFTGLRRLGDPVEMYYYPNEDHSLEHPIALMESLQRNVDWYRFWLQDYQRPAPEAAAQYRRWETLRNQMVITSSD